MAHCSIARYYGAWKQQDEDEDEDASTTYFLVFRLYGPNLDSALRRRSKFDLLAVLMDVAAALAHMHGANHVHRDVKTLNVVVRQPDGPALHSLLSAALILHSSLPSALLASVQSRQLSASTSHRGTVGRPLDLFCVFADKCFYLGLCLMFSSTLAKAEAAFEACWWISESPERLQTK